MKKKISNKNKNLHDAKKNKNDEFYTQLTDIEKELRNYKEHFKNKVVYCNCDDPYESNFFKYFAANFNTFKLKKLIAICYSGSPIVGGQLPLSNIKGLKDGEKEPFKLEINKVEDFNKDGAVDLSDVEWLLKNKKNTTTPLKQGGDFRSPECIELLKQVDIVVTNPPFSLFREYVAQLIEYNKKFIIIGNQNTIICKEIFPLIKDKKMWFGKSIHSGDREFRVPEHYPLNSAGNRIDKDGNRYIRIKGVRWFTNLDYKERHQDFLLYKTYKGNEDEYPKYDNYDAINVNKTKEIPIDYNGIMGVPITFIDMYNPRQFEIIGLDRYTGKNGDKDFTVNVKMLFRRILIKNKKPKLK